MNVVGRAAPPQRTLDDETKPLPNSVRTSGPPPTIVLLGETAASEGIGFATDSVRTLDVPPPGAGVNTVMARVPALATSAAVMMAASAVGDLKLVTRALPFTCMRERATKLAPVNVSSKPGPPAGTWLGLIAVNVGAGGGPGAGPPRS